MKVDVKSYVDERKKFLKDKISKKLTRPSLLILQKGDNSASNSYIRGKIKDGAEVGITVNLFKATHYTELLEILQKVGASYTGVILQEPSMLRAEERAALLRLISDKQDVDGFKPTSYHKPCTPAGIMDLLEYFYRWDLYEKTVVVVGRGALVGKPLVPMLIEKGATVISCNSGTDPLSAYTKQGDVVISATGQPGLITRDMLKDDAFVVDAGIFVDEKGKLHGDCDPALYDDENIEVTPVPGGVGLVTRVQLMQNVLNAAECK